MNMLSTGYPQNNEQMFLLPIASKRKEWYIEYKGSEQMFAKTEDILWILKRKENTYTK